MIFIIVTALFLGLPFAAKSYLIVSEKYLRRAHKAWAGFEQHARVLLEDKRLNPKIGDFVEFLALNVGNGSLTRSLLVSIIFRKTGRSKSNPEMDEAMQSLNGEQRIQFYRTIVSAVFYDSLRTPLFGSILRRILYWLAATAEDKSAQISRYEIDPAVAAAGRLCHA